MATGLGSLCSKPPYGHWDIDASQRLGQAESPLVHGSMFARIYDRAALAPLAVRFQEQDPRHVAVNPHIDSRGSQLRQLQRLTTKRLCDFDHLGADRKPRNHRSVIA